MLVTKQLDLLIQFGEFLNIEVYRRGFYQLQCRVYFGSDETKLRWDASPVRIVDKGGSTFEGEICTLETCQRGHTCTWRCSSQQRVYRTKMFKIEVKNEVVQINSSCVFSIELPAIVKESSKNTLFLEVDLYFADLEKSMSPTQDDLKFQQSRRFKLSDIFDKDQNLSFPVIYSHTMIQFDGIFWSACDMLVSVSSTGCVFKSNNELQEAQAKAYRIGSASMLDWVSGGVGLLFAEPAEATATPLLLKPVLLSCIHTLHQLQLSVEKARSSITITPLYLENPLSPNTLQKSIETMKIQDLSKYKILSDSKIISTVSSCLTAASPKVDGPKEAEESEVVDLMAESDAIINDFLLASSELEVVAGLVRVIELLSSKIQCVWMLFSTDGGIVPVEHVQKLRLDSMKQRLSIGAFHTGMLTTLEKDFVPTLQRIGKRQREESLISFCQQDDDFYRPVIISEYKPIKKTEVLETPGTAGTMDVTTSLAPLFQKADSNSNGTRLSETSEHSFTSLLALQYTFNRPKHLIVFVHGLLGSSFDFRIYRNQIMHTWRMLGFESTDQEYLMSEANEEHTLNDIEVLADRLASEIVCHIRDRKIAVERLSFVCHSLGGLIARCTIQNNALDPYRNKFDTFISLASPHLSLYFHNNSLVGSALKLYQYVGKSKCIDQMNLKDKTNPRASLIYKLAMGEENGLAKFKDVKFFGSPQDGYVPLMSSLADISDLEGKKVALEGQVSENATMIDVFIEMAEKLNSIPSLKKFSVLFGSLLSGGINLDVLGRKAHIAMLTEPALMELLVVLNNAHL